MNVPLLDLKAQYAGIKNEIKEALNQVCEEQWFILGKNVAALEEKIAAYSQAEFAVGVASGSDALLLSLMACDIKSGDEVITTPYTFFATAGSIARLGAKPVFVDIKPDTYNIDPALIEEKITGSTRAIIPVHLYGQSADMTPIMEIADKHGITVIEDAAQAIGSEYHGKRAGSIGHFGCFSFFPSKNLGGFGDGGMITTNNKNMADKLKMLRMHGSKPKYYHSIIGCNSRLDALQAAVILVKLQYLDNWTEGRRSNAERYNKLIAEYGLENCVSTPEALSHNRHIYNQYTIRTTNRDGLIAYLKEHGIGSEIYYPLPLHMQACFNYLGNKEGDYPVSEQAAKETMSLPVYPEVTETQQRYVMETIKQFYAK